MAVPKRKTSKSRKRKRRTHWKLKNPNLVECPQCHELKLSHRVCPSCGYYKGREVITKQIGWAIKVGLEISTTFFLFPTKYMTYLLL